MTYAASRLYEEVAYVAYHFHWDLDRILDLEHPLRQRFVDRDRLDQPADHGRGLTRWRRGGPSGVGRGTRPRPDRRSATPRDGHAGPSVVEPTAASNAWRDLPPLRPSAPAIELTAPVQRLADTMTSKQHTGVTSDEMGHIRAVDGPAGTVVGLLKPRVATHRERTGAGSLIYAAAAPEPIAGHVGGAVAPGPTSGHRTDRTPRATTGRGGGAGRAGRAGPFGRTIPRRRPAARRLDDRSPLTGAGCGCATDARRVDRTADRRRATGAGSRRAPQVAPARATPSIRHRRRSAVPESPSPTASVGRRRRPAPIRRRHRSGRTAPRQHPAGRRSSGPPASCGASASRCGSGRRAWCSTADSPAGERDVRLRWRSLPASLGSRTMAAVAPRPSLPEPGVVPDRVARPVASIDVASTAFPGRNVTPPVGRAAADTATRRVPALDPAPRRCAGRRRPRSRIEPAGDGPVTDHDAGARALGAGRRTPACNEHRRACPPTCGPSSSRCSARRSPTSRSTATPTRERPRASSAPRRSPPAARCSSPTGTDRRARRRGAHDPHPRTDPRRPATATRRVAAGRGVAGGCRARVGGAVGRRAGSSRADAARRAEPVDARRRSDSPASRRHVRCVRRHILEPHSPERARVGCRRWTSSPGCRPRPARRGSPRLRRPTSAATTPDRTSASVTGPGLGRTSGTAPPSVVQRLPGDSDGAQSDHHVDVVDATPRTRPPPTIRPSSTSWPGVCIHVSAPGSARTCSPTASARAGSSTSDDVKGDRRWRTQPSRTASR